MAGSCRPLPWWNEPAMPYLLWFLAMLLLGAVVTCALT